MKNYCITKDERNVLSTTKETSYIQQKERPTYNKGTSYIQQKERPTYNKGKSYIQQKERPTYNNRNVLRTTKEK